MTATPKMICRDEDGEYDRAETKINNTAERPFVSGAIGTAHVSLFESTDDEDRGGIVFRLLIQKGDCAFTFIPYAQNIKDGVELYLGGEAEAESMILALSESIDKRQRSRIQEKLTQDDVEQAIHITRDAMCEIEQDLGHDLEEKFNRYVKQLRDTGNPDMDPKQRLHEDPCIHRILCQIARIKETISSDDEIDELFTGEDE